MREVLPSLDNIRRHELCYRGLPAAVRLVVAVVEQGEDCMLVEQLSGVLAELVARDLVLLH